MNETISTLSSRHEFLFLYDIKMGNPNGDPDENRPRVLPDGSFYVTDVRLKRFVRDYLKTQTFIQNGQKIPYEILVDTVEGKTTNLTNRVAEYLKKTGKKQCQGKELVDILLDAFIDARLFGSSFAFKGKEIEGNEEEVVENTESSTEPEAEGKTNKKKAAKPEIWKPEPEPKTLTGPVQIHHGEVLHKAQEIDIRGTCILGSQESKTQGTFTNYFVLRYALIAFCGIANEHSAKLSHLSNNDYRAFLDAMWKGIRSAANTRTKSGQIPRLLIDVEYKPGVEFQYGRLTDYVKLRASQDKPEKEWSTFSDYKVDLSILMSRLAENKDKIAQISYEISPDIQLVSSIPVEWKKFSLDETKTISEG